MNFLDKLKGLGDKAEDLAADHKDEVQGAIDKAGNFVDDKTGGKYHDKIEDAEAKADDFVEGLDGDEAEAKTQPGAPPPPPAPPAA
jgi:hypothetical protein